jgi:hypothetical protein
MAYLLDTNVFIEAKNLYYGMDFCAAFWDWLTRENGAGKIYSVEKVGDELQAGTDELSAWAAAQGERLFLRPNAEVIASFTAISAWASSQSYEPAAVSTFLQVADYYIVAQAHAARHTVVTRETPATTPRKIKIPNACIGLGIKCVTPFEMLRRERARFVLEPHH